MKDSFFTNESYLETELDRLLALTPSLEELFKQPNFMSSLFIAKRELIDFLAREDILKEVLRYMSEIKDPMNNSHERCYHYPFYAFNVFSHINSKIIETFINCKELVDTFFKLCLSEDENMITVQGYLQTIFRNYMSDINPLYDEFVLLVIENFEIYILPLVQKMTKSNSEILVCVLINYHHKLKEKQQRLFEAILTRYLGKTGQENETYIDYLFNTIDIVKRLNEENFVYEYKIKYDSSVGVSTNVDIICLKYQLKLLILIYLVKSEQIKTLNKAYELFISYKQYVKVSKSKESLKLNLQLFSLISANPTFKQCIDHRFIKALLDVVLDYPRNDVLHSLVFKTLINLVSFIDCDEQAKLYFINFVHKVKKESNKGKKLNIVSFEFVHKLLDKIHLGGSNVSDLGLWRDELKKRYSRLLFDETPIELSYFDEESDVEVIKLNPNEALESDDWWMEDNRFNDEPEIPSPEALSNSEKLSSGSFLIHKDLFDSFIGKEPNLKDSFAQLEIKERKTASQIITLKDKNTDIVDLKWRSPVARRNTTTNETFRIKKHLISPLSSGKKLNDDKEEKTEIKEIKI